MLEGLQSFGFVLPIRVKKLFISHYLARAIQMPSSAGAPESCGKAPCYAQNPVLQVQKGQLEYGSLRASS
jgi:hypothetical protein